MFTCANRIKSRGIVHSRTAFKPCSLLFRQSGFVHTTSFQRLYLPIGIDNVEDIDEYRPGGYHPVHIGDHLTDRYKVLHKLGAGGFSTTWLTRDHLEECYVAVKILKAEETASNSEVRVLRHIAKIRSDHPGRNHIRLLRDHFEIRGPNGVHTCLVFDVAGPSISELYNIPRSGFPAGARRLRAHLARRVNRQLVNAVDFLHSNQICHGGKTRHRRPLLVSDE